MKLSEVKEITVAKYIGMTVSALLFLVGIGLTVWSLFLGPHWGMLASCLVLTLFLGFFVHADVRYLQAYFKNTSHDSD